MTWARHIGSAGPRIWYWLQPEPRPQWRIGLGLALGLGFVDMLPAAMGTSPAAANSDSADATDLYALWAREIGRAHV